VRKQQANLFQDCPRGPLRELREELRKVPWPLGILRVKAFRSDLTEDLIAELRMVEFLQQHVKALRHGLGEVLVVLQGLHNGGLGGGSMAMMFDRETDDFVDSKLDRLGLHVLLVLRDVVRRRSETSTMAPRRNGLPYGEQTCYNDLEKRRTQ
jgi:hypothetical protein